MKSRRLRWYGYIRQNTRNYRQDNAWQRRGRPGLGMIWHEQIHGDLKLIKVTAHLMGRGGNDCDISRRVVGEAKAYPGL